MKNPVSSLQPVPKSQRTEVRLHELTKQERDQFEQAKATEVANWIQTKTLTKVMRNQIPESQILRCRWILTWKPLDTLAESQKPPGLLSIGVDEGVRIHILSGRRMQNIQFVMLCKTHMKHRFLRWWNVCDAYVKRCAAQVKNIMWAVCEIYVETCEIHVIY